MHCIKAESGGSVMSQSGRSLTESSAVQVVVVDDGAVLQSVCLGMEAALDA